jgi:LPXTG-motif cell wall-anchored protein
MMEITAIGLVIIVLAGLLLWHRRRQGLLRKSVDYVCPRCNENDCHCERRS